MLVQALSRAGSLALDQLLPERCGVCGRYGGLLCEVCAGGLAPAAGARCRRCWMSFAREICPRCDEYGSACTAVRACFIYSEGARRLVAAVKYQGAFALTAPMHRLMAACWPQWGLRADLVMPVPLHPRRQRQRGFNQSALLAAGVSAALGLPLEASLLRRRRATQPQVRVGDESRRRANVFDAFACDGHTLEGARVLLVDDVTTTGATLGACADAVFEAGASTVYGFAFAIAG